MGFVVLIWIATVLWALNEKGHRQRAEQKCRDLVLSQPLSTPVFGSSWKIRYTKGKVEHDVLVQATSEGEALRLAIGTHQVPKDRIIAVEPQ